MLMVFSSNAIADVFMVVVMGMAMLAWLVAITLPIKLLLCGLRKRRPRTTPNQ